MQVSCAKLDRIGFATFKKKGAGPNYAGPLCVFDAWQRVLEDRLAMTREARANRGELAARDASSRADAHRGRQNTRCRTRSRLDVSPNLVNAGAIDISLSRNRVGATVNGCFVLEVDLPFG